LIADGYHARVDGFTSLAVLLGAIGVWLGFPLADPIIGLCITITILKIVWDSVKTVFIRLLDGVEPEIIDEIKHEASHVAEVKEVTEIRARWIGHFLHVDLNIAVDPHLSVEQGHAIAAHVRQELMHHRAYVSNTVVQIDPVKTSAFHSQFKKIS
jgi:cation diffusion facilitator family transporter